MADYMKDFLVSQGVICYYGHNKNPKEKCQVCESQKDRNKRRHDDNTQRAKQNYENMVNFPGFGTNPHQEHADAAKKQAELPGEDEGIFGKSGTVSNDKLDSLIDLLLERLTSRVDKITSALMDPKPKEVKSFSTGSIAPMEDPYKTSGSTKAATFEPVKSNRLELDPRELMKKREPIWIDGRRYQVHSVFEGFSDKSGYMKSITIELWSI